MHARTHACMHTRTRMHTHARRFGATLAELKLQWINTAVRAKQQYVSLNIDEVEEMTEVGHTRLR